jgi:predicted signal transduction protein with EAL and GGDEF domain
MLDLNTLCEFSRLHCIAICAVLVPANLLATSQTLLMAWFHRPLAQIWLMCGVASLYSLIMVLHVATWFMIGVVMIPTYVLLGLGSTCLISNLLALSFAYSQRRELLQKV